MSTDADLATALNALNQRLDRLEAKVDALGGGGPASTQLADPEVQQGLAELLTRLDKATAMVDALGTLSQRLPVVGDAVATSASWAWAQAEAEGIDPIATGKRGAALSLELAKPENLDLAERLLQRKGDLLVLLDAADAIDPDDLQVLATQGAGLTKKMAAMLKLPELARLLDAGADSAALSTAEAATTALVQTRSEAIEPVGLFGVLGKMGDPDVQRAVGFTFALAKRFGQLLGK
jgi:uncharacterized protein YjgD (DUF1641 family)